MKTLYFIAVAFAAASVYLNKKSDAWAERPASLMLFMMWRSFARDETKEERNRERTDEGEDYAVSAETACR